MTLDGARIYFEGVNPDHKYDDKIRQIVNTVKSVAPSSDVGMRILKRGKVYEGLLWGRANDIPLGVYRRGQSMGNLLEILSQRVKKECQKAWKVSGVRAKGSTSPRYPEMANIG